MSLIYYWLSQTFTNRLWSNPFKSVSLSHWIVGFGFPCAWQSIKTDWPSTASVGFRGVTRNLGGSEITHSLLSIVHIRHGVNLFNLPMTSTVIDELMIPWGLEAMQIYTPASDNATFGKCKVPFTSIRWLGIWKNGSPSYTSRAALFLDL